MIQIITIVLLSFLSVSLIVKFIGIPYYRQKKIYRETLRKQEIHKIVDDYLKSIVKEDA